ncbi:hypothetical protein HYFRA_00010845 [Hymenoscyphus fraxineus]|uniref:Uncharacterized protein n=1 Tax=Hymenoscyphus fraxineus TaxID=746836 RepID=A0A9N9PI31_9HELO|nr:hypothetical protein HYFRA_00010845 [Hymenoscyphus fraxineus]
MLEGCYGVFIPWGETRECVSVKVNRIECLEGLPDDIDTEDARSEDTESNEEEADMEIDEEYQQQTKPTEGNLPEDISTFIRFPRKTKFLAGHSIASIGTPWRLQKVQLTAFSKHYGGQYVPQGSINNPTTIVVVGMNLDPLTLKQAYRCLIPVVSQTALFEVAGDRARGGKLTRGTAMEESPLQSPSKRQRV